MPDSGSRVLDSGSAILVPCPGLRILNPESRIPFPETGSWNLGSWGGAQACHIAALGLGGASGVSHIGAGDRGESGHVTPAMLEFRRGGVKFKISGTCFINF